MTLTQTTATHVGTPPTEPHTILVTATDDTLTDGYTVVLNYDFDYWPDSKIITVLNVSEDYGLKYMAYGAIAVSPSTADWHILVSEQLVNKVESDAQIKSDGWRHIKVECKNAVGGNASNVKVQIRTVLDV